IRPGTRAYSGSMRRQIDTARGCPRITGGREPKVDARWNEYDSAAVVLAHGRLEVEPQPAGLGAPAGMTSRDFQAILEGALLAWIAAGDASPCEETWPAFQGRAVTAMRELADAGEDALVFSSGGTIAAVAVAL